MKEQQSAYPLGIMVPTMTPFLIEHDVVRVDTFSQHTQLAYLVSKKCAGCLDRERLPSFGFLPQGNTFLWCFVLQ